MPAEMSLDGFGYGHVSSFAFSPDGKSLATGHPDGTILLWDAGLPAGKPAPARPGELESLWKQLGEDDAKRAYHAAWRLAELPAEAVPLLRGKLRPARAASDKVTAPLVADLDGDTLAKRDAATRRLRELGHAAWPAVAEALKAPASAEQKRRLAQLLAELERPGVPGGDRLRDLRAVQVLGWVGTPEARKVLDALAEGNAFDPLTQQAKASLARR
jgi:DNA-binding transcriptional ArsR family regulator